MLTMFWKGFIIGAMVSFLLIVAAIVVVRIMFHFDDNDWRDNERWDD